MEDNVIYMICEMETGRILDCKRHALINEISFSSIFPSKEMASNYRKREMGDSQGEYFTIVEGEIVEFHNNQLTVAYEEFVTNKKYSSWSW
jgi:hypothetical protein